MQSFRWVDIDGIRYSWDGQGHITCAGQFGYQASIAGDRLDGVEIENDAGEQKTLRIVGVDEIYDHHPQHISIESPMARALLSKQVDDEVEVITPLGKKLWYINSIRYEKSQNQ